MITIAVSIFRWVDEEPWPGILECKLTDRFGRDWFFIEKTAVLSSETLLAGSEYPQAGIIACRIIATGRDEHGRETAEIDTEEPWDVKSVYGITRFHVFADQLTNQIPS